MNYNPLRAASYPFEALGAASNDGYRWDKLRSRSEQNQIDPSGLQEVRVEPKPHFEPEDVGRCNPRRSTSIESDPHESEPLPNASRPLRSK